MSKKKPAERVNTLPRFLPEQGSPDATKLMSKSLNLTRLDRTEIQRLLKSEDDSEARNQAVHKMQNERAEEIQRRKLHEKDIYNLDYGVLDDTFALPSKPDPKSTLPATTHQKTRPRKAKAESPQKIDSTETRNFLPTALGLEGHVTSSFGNETNTAPTTHAKTLSDLDEIHHIMSGIKTSEDAINFFARYGADTPVCSLLILVGIVMLVLAISFTII